MEKPKLMSSVEFWGSLLTSLGLTIDQTGAVLIPNDDEDGDAIPYQINDKPVYLPLESFLRNKEERDKVQLFHPCWESPIRKEAPTFSALKQLIIVRVSDILDQVLQVLMNIAATPELQGNLNPVTQQWVLTELSKADARTFKYLNKVLDKCSATNPLFALYIKNRGVVGGEEYRQAAIVTFPFMNGIADSKNVIAGVKAERNSDRDMVVELMEAVLPGSTTEEGRYSAGSNHLEAPKLAAMLEAYAKVTTRLNVIVTSFAENFTNASALLTNHDWVESIPALSRFRAEIPAQVGNDGAALDVSPSGKDASDRDEPPKAKSFTYRDEPVRERTDRDPAPRVDSPEPEPNTGPGMFSIVGNRNTQTPNFNKPTSQVRSDNRTSDEERRLSELRRQREMEEQRLRDIERRRYEEDMRIAEIERERERVRRDDDRRYRDRDRYYDDRDSDRDYGREPRDWRTIQREIELEDRRYDDRDRGRGRGRDRDRGRRGRYR